MMGPTFPSVALGEAANRGAIAASPPPIARLALSATGSTSALRLRVRSDIVLAPRTRPARCSQRHLPGGRAAYGIPGRRARKPGAWNAWRE